MSEEVLLEIREKIAYITLNRPQSLNSMNAGLVEGVHLALDQAEADAAVRVIILTGAGKAFCAGGDLTYLETLESTADKKAFIEKVGAMTQKIMHMQKPVIAMVNGVTAGAGVNLMLACDLVYAVDTARFAQSFAKVGLVPDCGGMYLLPKTIGVHKAKELMYTADLIDCATADKLGMINHVCTAATLQEETEKMAQRLAASAPIALGIIKSTLNDRELSLDQVLAIESTAQPLCLATKDCAEGIKAFKEKRSPQFSGK